MKTKDTKQCTKCGEVKELSLFHKQHTHPTGRNAQCARCRTDAQIARRNTLTEAEKKALYRARNLMANYGITVTEYDSLLESQDYACAICGKSEEDELAEMRTRLHVDHCHTTDKVRGLLCNGCNTAIGKFKENLEVLTKAIDYLKKHNDTI